VVAKEISCLAGRDFDAAFFVTKSKATAEALASLVPVLPEKSVRVTMPNGMWNSEVPVEASRNPVARVVRLPDIRVRLGAIAIETSGNTSDEFARITAADTAKWTVVVKAANLKAN
jgi:ketopantoate reductase